MLKGGQSLANASPGTCLRASFYARAPLAAPFTPYSIRSLTIIVITLNKPFLLINQLNLSIKIFVKTLIILIQH